MLCQNNLLYGNYRTRKFTDIFGSADIFLDDFNTTPFKDSIKQESLNILYYLLYSKYGNSHIANSDENQFKYKLYSIIFMYGPTWEKELDLQKKIRELSEEEAMLGNTTIMNHSYNPSTAPSTDTLDELITIDDQNTSKFKKSKLSAYENIIFLLKKDVTNDFLLKFKNLFLVIVEPYSPLWYETEINTEE